MSNEDLVIGLIATLICLFSAGRIGWIIISDSIEEWGSDE
jgi:hypothetical protein